MHDVNLPVVRLGREPPTRDGPRFLSQSEAGDALACGVKWLSRWFYEIRDSDESPRQQVGSMAHAILADRVTARFRGEEASPNYACGMEAARRGWRTGWYEVQGQALDAANLVAREMNLDHAHLLPDLWTSLEDAGGPRPLAEVRLRAPWNKIVWAFRDQDRVSPGWRDVMACGAVHERFAGIEGQPDLVYLPEGPGGPVAIVDYKFRQRPDLGGAGSPPQGGLPLPDRQGAWYLTLLRALGMAAPSGFEFRQVNAYAGRWLSVEDFLGPSPGALVTDRGLPTRDLDRLVDAGGMVTADVWAEAHRELARRRHLNRLAQGPRREPQVLTPAEEADARRMVETLRAWRPVVVKQVRADPLVCREVVRDMVVGVEGPLSMALRGVTPARHLQTYNGSPCTRPWGCPVAGPCQSSLGTFNVAEALQQSAEDARDAADAAEETEAAHA